MFEGPRTRDEMGDYDKPGGVGLRHGLQSIEGDRKMPVAELNTPWLTVAEAAKYLSVNADFIYDACATGGLRHARLGGRRSIRTRQKWLDDWMHSNAAAGVR